MTNKQYERFNKIKDYLKSNYDKKETYKIIDKDKNYIIINLNKIKRKCNITYRLLKELDKLKNKNLKLDFNNNIDIAIIKKEELKKWLKNIQKIIYLQKTKKLY